MVKDHSDSEKGNPLSPHGLLLSINSKVFFICTIPDRIAHTTAFVIPVVEHWLEREIAQWVDPTTHRTMSERSYYRATSCSSFTMNNDNEKSLNQTSSILTKPIQ